MSEKISLSNTMPVQDAVPSEAVALPSEGKFYPAGHPLHNAEFIEIRPMTARDEDILTSRALFKTGKVIDTLLRSCILTKGIDVSQLLIGDRNATIIGIRSSGYGSNYETRIECPMCNEKTSLEVNLAELPLKTVPEDVNMVAPYTNEISFKLPVSTKTVNFRLATGADEQELSILIERLRKTTGSENMITNRLMQQIISIDGETDKNKLSAVIRNMPARDSRELRDYMDHCTPDVKLVQKFSCPVCAFESEEVEVPLGTDFFWPKSRG
jgi:hypothetical protein